MANLSIGKTVITKALAGRKSVKGMVYFLHGACMKILQCFSIFVTYLCSYEIIIIHKLIFIGDDGFGLQTWVNKTINGNFAFKYFPVVYPSSPVRSYSLHDGKVNCHKLLKIAYFLTINYDE